jgi:hypothetical protein
MLGRLDLSPQAHCVPNHRPYRDLNLLRLRGPKPLLTNVPVQIPLARSIHQMEW